MDFDLYAVSFTDLRTLLRVFDTGSFTRASEEIGVNQSAVSYTIDKLRKHFGDPLFVRLGGGISATERCSEIVTATRRLLADYESIALPREFDPASAMDKVTIACNYLERLLILPDAIKAIREAAPGLSVEIISSTSEGDQHLKQGSASLLIGPLVPVETGFYSRKLFEEHYVCVMDRDNPMATGSLQLEDYLDCNHVLITYGGAWKSRYLGELEAMGHQLRNVLAVPSPAGVQELLLGTDLVVTVPSGIADQYDARFKQAQAPVPAPFDVHLVWTERTHQSALHRWVRDLVVTSAKAS